jgi:hypothetical protein
MFEFGRLFSMSAFEGARQLRLRRVTNPTMTVQQIIEIIQSVDAEGGSYDFEAAIHLDSVLSGLSQVDDAFAFYRDCIEVCIRQHRPTWARTLAYGRKLVQKLSPDEQQCFAASGLMDDPPSEGTVSWWDKTAAIARLVADGIKMDQGRAAEKKTLDYEAKRLAKLGINATPRWVSVDDNKLGYDILSFDNGPDGPISRVLEVKSTIASPPRYFVTRNEWEVCKKMGNAYLFHIWDMKTGNLFERRYADVEPHIPCDRNTGRWSVAEIRIGSSQPASPPI